MRIRSIKPDFWASDDVASLSVEDRLLFIGLWSYVDDNGVGRDEDHLIIGALFARDMFDDPRETVARVSRGLQKLSEAGLIVRYEHDGKRFLQVTGWEKHQRIDHPQKPRFPQYDAIRDTLATSSRDSRETLAPGTGEQGNRGTGDISIARSARCAPDKPAPKPDAEPDGFADFYAAYPRHVGRRQAAKAYRQALRRASPTTILTAARRLAADPNLPEERFIKHPATWLNSDGWADDPPPAPQGRPQASAGGQTYFDLATQLAHQEVPDAD